MASVNNLTRLRQVTSSIIIARLQTIKGVTATTVGRTVNEITEISCSTGSRMYFIIYRILRNGSMIYDIKEIPPSRNTRNTTTFNKIKGIMNDCGGRSVNEGTMMYGYKN